MLERTLLGAIVIGYLVVGVLYALQVPPWQAPDEPAHFNYIAQIAEAGCCPVIEMGDWDNDYLERLKSARFPQELTGNINQIEYEDHQPPLYYLLASAIYRVTGGSLVAIRLFSVVLGAGTVLCVYGVGRLLAPGRHTIALAAAALTAYIPQHVAILSSVNNDALAGLLIGLTLLVAGWYLGREPHPPRTLQMGVPVICGVLGAVVLSAGGTISILLALLFIVAGLVIHFFERLPLDAFHQWHWMLGLLVGAAFVTKTTAYFLLAVVLLAVAIRPLVMAASGNVGKSAGVALRVAGALGKLAPPMSAKTKRRFGLSFLQNTRRIYAPVMRRSAKTVAVRMVWVLGVALAFGLVWWVRNIVVYDGFDFLGLAAHDRVVVGQRRTAEGIALRGFWPYVWAGVQTTFNSFWGQLGWMALPLPGEVYRRIGLMLLLSFSGLILNSLRGEAATPAPRQIAMGALLVLTAVLALAAFTIYNLSYEQFQGRYLFAAIIPFTLLVAAGLDAWTQLVGRWVRPRQVAELVPYATPLLLAAVFGAFNLWLVRFIVPLLAP